MTPNTKFILISILVVLQEVIGSELFFVSNQFLQLTLFIEIISLIILFQNYNSILRYKASKIALTFLCYSTIIIIIHGNKQLHTYGAIVYNSWWCLMFLMYIHLFNSEHPLKTIKSTRLIFILSFIIFSILVIAIVNVQAAIAINNTRTNQVLYMMGLIPFVIFIKKPGYRISFLIIIVILTLFTLKRSAILISLGCSSIYVFHILSISKKKKYSIIFTLIISGVVGYQIIDHIIDYYGIDPLKRFEQISEDGGSGREDAVLTVLNQTFEKDGIDIIFGNAYDAVRSDKLVKVYGEYISAHNDLAEMLYDYGIIGLLIYIAFVWQAIKLCLFWKNKNTHYYAGMMMFLLAFGISTFVSHLWLYPRYIVYYMIFLAFMYNQKRLYCKDRNKYYEYQNLIL